MPSKAKKTQTPNGLPQPQTTANTLQNQTRVTQPLSVVSPNGQHTYDKRDSESRTGDTTESAGEPFNEPSINRKKQKRREKEAAKRAAQQDLANGHVPDPSTHSIPLHGRGPTKGYFTEEVDPDQPDFAEVGSPDDAFYSGDEDPEYDPLAPSQSGTSWLNTSKRNKSKPKKSSNPGSNAISRTSTAPSRPHIPSVSNAALRSAHRMGDSLWNPSTQAERENIKQFWLDLGEEERRSLVKIEKEAVLRKMKEQQKHSCSCSVCGRKRTAIEEELEVLYDAYYEELEQFANHNPDLANAPQLMAPPRPTLRRGLQPIPGSFSSRGRVREIGEDDEDLDEDEEYDDEDEPYSDEDEDDLDIHGLPPGPPDFFQFGNSLTVKDGILTVADDLLKNDGRHFIDMMEQLAERRMQREEEVHFPSSALTHQDIHQGHNHAPLDDEDEYDDEEDDDEDYDSQDEDDYEGDEMDSMTEEQRMEEGRRMFQIFAARMFEQRVLTAYREKVAAERQARLLEELDEENRLDTQREAKKAREAAKKKEKKKAQKAAKEEEKSKKEAEKAAQEAAAREAEERRLEDQRQKKEDQRKKREAERKATEEERLRKEAEKQRRQQEQKERQAEAERKAREAKDRERQKKEDAKKKVIEEREARQKEDKERKAKEAQGRKTEEEQTRRGKTEMAAKTEREARERSAPQTTMRSQPVALPPGLHPATRGMPLQSPNLAVVTPIVPPKVPTPGRGRQASQTTQSHSSSPRSQQTGTEQSSTSPAILAAPYPSGQPQAQKTPGQPPLLHHPQPSAPRSPLNNPGRNQHAFNMNGLPGLGVSAAPPNGPSLVPGMMPQMPMYQGPPMGHHPRFGPNGMQYPPNYTGPRQFHPTQPMPFHSQGPMTMPVQTPQNPVPKASHSRQPSGSTTTETSSQPAPIARPGPIARPSSTTPDRQKTKDKVVQEDVDQITTQLGSKALLDDSDEPIPSGADTRAGLAVIGAPGTGRMPFASSFESKTDGFGMGSQTWGGFGSSSGWGAPGPQRSGSGWTSQPFGGINHAPAPAGGRPHLPRPIAVRLMLVQACRQLAASGEGFHPLAKVLAQLEMMKAPGEASVSMDEMLSICETEGNSQNGGGSFEVMADQGRGQGIKFTEDIAPPRGSVGDIGSPVPHHAQPSFFPVGFGPPGRGF